MNDQKFNFDFYSNQTLSTFFAVKEEDHFRKGAITINKLTVNSFGMDVEVTEQ